MIPTTWPSGSAKRAMVVSGATSVRGMITRPPSLPTSTTLGRTRHRHSVASLAGLEHVTCYIGASNALDKTFASRYSTHGVADARQWDE